MRGCLSTQSRGHTKVDLPPRSTWKMDVDSLRVTEWNEESFEPPVRQMFGGNEGSNFGVNYIKDSVSLCGAPDADRWKEACRKIKDGTCCDT